jgi:hypothetical protein
MARNPYIDGVQKRYQKAEVGYAAKHTTNSPHCSNLYQGPIYNIHSKGGPNRRHARHKIVEDVGIR